MEAQRQLVEMNEDLVGDAPHGIHGDSCKERVARLCEKLHEDAQQRVDDHHRDRPGQDRGQGHVGTAIGQQIRRPFERIGHGNGDELGDQQQSHGTKHARLQVGTV